MYVLKTKGNVDYVKWLSECSRILSCTKQFTTISLSLNAKEQFEIEKSLLLFSV